MAAGRFKLGTEALDDMTRMKRRAEEKESEKANKKVMDYTAALNKMQEIRALNKQEHECTFVLGFSLPITSFFRVTKTKTLFGLRFGPPLATALQWKFL